jgi:hypothetical protein
MRQTSGPCINSEELTTIWVGWEKVAGNLTASNPAILLWVGWEKTAKKLNGLLRPVSIGVSLEFHLHLIACHVCTFDDMTTFNEEREELSFMEIKLSWHSYQLSISHKI